MKPVRPLFLVAAIAGICLLSVLPAADGPPKGAPLKGDVVLIRCDFGSAEIPLTAFQGSPGTPSRKAVSCAESLSLLLKEGFHVREITRFDETKSTFAVYTLLR